MRDVRLSITGAGVLFIAASVMVGLKLWWGVDLSWTVALAPAAFFLIAPLGLIVLVAALCLLILALVVATVGAFLLAVVGAIIVLVGMFLLAPTWKPWEDGKNVARNH